jgi:uncharacterized membrane protein
MKLDAIGVLTKDETGKINLHKLGRQTGRKGMGVGVALGLISAALTGGLTLPGGAVVGGIAGGIVGRLFNKRIKVSDDDVARINRELAEGCAMVGVLTWDFDTGAVADKLRRLGGTPQIVEVVKAAARG